MTSLHKTLFTQTPTTLHQLMCQMGRESSWKKLENIEEEEEGEVKSTVPPHQPETPTETMEFLGRSWSISAVELSRAFFDNSNANSNSILLSTLVNSNKEDKRRQEEEDSSSIASSRDLLLPQIGNKTSPPISPRTGKEIKHLYKSMIRRRTMGRRLKDQKEKKKQETRTRNAQIHAAVSVAGVAAVVAANAASIAIKEDGGESSTIAVAVASAAAFVASHCIEMAGEIGAGYNQITTAVNSATNAKTNGDVMALTASAATALRGAAILRSRMERNQENKSMMLHGSKEKRDGNVFGAMTFVSRGEELLKRTRKGDLHWKQVSFNINSSWKVVLKMKSKHVGGTFTKTKKYVVNGVCRDICGWAQRGKVGHMIDHKAYFGIKTVERVIEFECENEREKQMWIEGIQQLLHSLESLS